MEEFLASGMHWKLVNFFAFVGMLFFFLKKPVQDFWKSRAHHIRFQIDESRKLLDEAREKNEQLKKRVMRLEQEVTELVRSLETDGELEKKKIMQEADRLAIQMKEDAERGLTHEVQKVRQALKAEAVKLSFEMAQKMIRENFKETDQKRMTEKYLADMERGIV